jgi:hypothetical protein
MKAFLTILTFSLITICNAQGKKQHFAVGIFVSANSQLITYAIVTEINGKIIGTQILREQRFFYYIMGYWPTAANPTKENLLEKNGIDSCFLVKNYSNKINGYFVKPFYNLWKLRYKSHPIAYDIEDGWSNGYYKPSAKQAYLLDTAYNVPNVKLNMFMGDNLFKLLRDMQRPEWIDLYSSLGD